MSVRFSSVRLVSIAALACVAVLPVASASAAPKQGKDYTFAVKPSEPAGTTDHAYNFTLTNKTRTQQLGSANIELPNNLTLLPPLAPTATLDDATKIRAPDATAIVVAGPSRTLQLRNLAAPPEAAVTVTVDAQMPCSGALDYTNKVVAKQSNDFSSTSLESNVLTLLPFPDSTLMTTLSGSCQLRFVDEVRESGAIVTPSGHPASAKIGTRIFADPFADAFGSAPESANRVTVEALDAISKRLTWFNGDVTITSDEITRTGETTALTATRAAASGLARFDNLVINTIGNYKLIASDGTGFTPGTSKLFQIVDKVETCNSAGCSAAAASDQTSSALTGANVGQAAGLALLTRNLGGKPNCDGYVEAASDWYEFQLFGVAADMTVSAFVNKGIVRKLGGVSSVDICFAASLPFDVEPGTVRSEIDYDGDSSNGVEGFVGRLPAFTGTGIPPSPMITGRIGTSGGGAIVTFVVPKAWGSDPRYGS